LVKFTKNGDHLAWHEIQTGFVTFSVKVKPNKQETKIMSVDDDFVYMSVNAPPVDGKANEEIISFLSKNFNVSKKSIEFLRGQKSKTKFFRLKITTEVTNFIEEIKLKNRTIFDSV